MRKLLLLTFFLFFSFTNAFSQAYAYYPNGKKIPYKLTTINAMKDSLGIDDVHLSSTPYGDVLYKKFTNTPVVILFYKTPDLTKIPLMVAKFNYQKYINTYSYYADLQTAKEKFTTDYLLKNLGEPDNWEFLKLDTSSSEQSWTYRKKNLTIYMNGNSATKIDVINYRGIDQYGFSIIDYTVTGEDYTIGFDITFMNVFPSKKTIKYIYLTVTAKNPVNDIVATKTVRAIGPIKRGEAGDYKFDDIIYSKTASSLTINSIKVQFMDGTFKSFTKAQIDAVTLVDWKAIGEELIN